METITKFQNRFIEWLKYSNIKHSDLAKAANVSKQCISDYKSGKSVPSIDTLYLICKYLDISADYLLGLND
jgi:transcriptional regulator with XRE-family HTH domain